MSRVIYITAVILFINFGTALIKTYANAHGRLTMWVHEDNVPPLVLNEGGAHQLGRAQLS